MIRMIDESEPIAYNNKSGIDRSQKGGLIMQDKNEKNKDKVEKRSFMDMIEERKKGSYYLYYQFYRPLELAFFGAFLGIFLSLLYTEILGLGVVAKEPDVYFNARIFTIMWLTVWCLVSLAVFVAGFDYSLPRWLSWLLYAVAAAIYLFIGGAFIWMIRTTFTLLFPRTLWWKASFVLPITYGFWAFWHEVMMRCISAGLKWVKNKRGGGHI